MVLRPLIYYLNNLDDTGKVKFTMQVANGNGLEFLGLKLKIVERIINGDVYSKPTNSFTYVLLSTYFPHKKIRNVPKGIALRLRRIFDTDENYNQHSSEYQHYLIGRECNPTLIKQQFEEVGKMTRIQAGASKQNPYQEKKTIF